MKPLNELIEELDEARGKATEGEWVVVTDLPSYAIMAKVGTGPFYPKIVQTENQHMFKHSDWKGGIESDVNADYIALANPENIGRILDHCDDLKRKYDEAMDNSFAQSEVLYDAYLELKYFSKKNEELNNCVIDHVKKAYEETRDLIVRHRGEKE